MTRHREVRKVTTATGPGLLTDASAEGAATHGSAHATLVGGLFGMVFGASLWDRTA